MRFPFRALPAASGGQLTPRPVVDVWLEGIDRVPLGCLVDTGAVATRFSAEVAEAANLGLKGTPQQRLMIAGVYVNARSARVGLRLGTGAEAAHWDANVWFCEPWPFAFQLLGLEGFLRSFRVTISAYHEWVDCALES